MKKIVSLMLSVLMILSLSAICAAAELSADVYVTISDKDGNLAVAAEQVTVTDTDNDGKLTITDVLYCTHEAFYDGGAAAGYATVDTQYGLSLDKLWGAANGGSYGYYLNGASAWSLTDEVKTDDYLYAFVYTDPVGWSDKFSTFNRFMGDVDANEGVELTLTYVADYDDNFMPVFAPLSGAKITVNGEATAFMTDENGKVKVTFDSNGTAIVSAKSDDVNIAPPVFKANVTGAAEPTEEVTEAPSEAATKAATADQVTPSTNTNTNAIQTGDAHTMIYLVLMMLVLAFGIVVYKKQHEK